VSLPLLSFCSVCSSFSSKIEAGRLQLDLAPHNLLDTTETAAMLTYNLATAKALDVGWFVDPALPPLLYIDSTRVQQVRAAFSFFSFPLASPSAESVCTRCSTPFPLACPLDLVTRRVHVRILTPFRLSAVCA